MRMLWSVGILVGLAVAAPAFAEGVWLGLDLDPHPGGGVSIAGVLPDSPAAAAGLHRGDVLVAVDKKAVSTPEDVVALVRNGHVGTKLKLGVSTATGLERVVEVSLAERPSGREIQGKLIGHAAPDFAPSVQSGEKVSRLSSLKGQVVVLDFFATWCRPCVAAMPHLQGLHKKLGARGLRVLGISSEAPEVVAGAAQRFGVDYPLASDESEEVSRQYRISAIPTMVVVDRRGVVRNVSVADLDAVDAAIEAALATR